MTGNASITQTFDRVADESADAGDAAQPDAGSHRWDLVVTYPHGEPFLQHPGPNQVGRAECLCFLSTVKRRTHQARVIARDVGVSPGNMRYTPGKGQATIFALPFDDKVTAQVALALMTEKRKNRHGGKVWYRVITLV